mgnify:CR=1 FL=1
MTRPVNRMRPVHPGEVLREDYLVPLGLSVNALAVALGVPATRIHEIVKERRAVTADTAARLARYFGGDAASWLVMQANCGLKTLPTLEAIEREYLGRLLAKYGGNRRQVAEALGVSERTAYRMLERHGYRNPGER